MKVFNGSYICKYEYEDSKIDNFNAFNQVCYSGLFRKLGYFHSDNIVKETRKDVTLKLYIPKDFSKENAQCLLNKKEVLLWINNLKKVIKFEYSIKYEYIENNYKGFIITITTPEITVIELKFMITYLRYLYEGPFNVILKEAMVLRRFGFIKSKNILNIYQVVAPFQYYNSNHSIESNNYLTRPMSIPQLKNKLKEHSNKAVVQNLFNRTWTSINTANYFDSGIRLSDYINNYNDFRIKSVTKRYDEIYSRCVAYYKDLNIVEFK